MFKQIRRYKLQAAFRDGKAVTTIDLPEPPTNPPSSPSCLVKNPFSSTQTHVSSFARGEGGNDTAGHAPHDQGQNCVKLVSLWSSYPVCEEEGWYPAKVIDFRALNKQTVKNRYPLPRIDDLLDQLQGAKVFISLDLLSGYHQVPLHASDIPKTAFRTPQGSFQFKVLSMGLTNAPSTFAHVMNNVFKDLLGK